MKTSTPWKRGQSSKKKQRVTYKPKIRWELLGLSDPEHRESTTSIETIREQVSTLAREGFGLGPRVTAKASNPKSRGRNRPTAGTPARRRGATE